MAPVNQYSDMFASRWSRVTTVSKSPSWSVHVWNFSAIHAASPAGESVKAYASVCGRVPWI